MDIVYDGINEVSLKYIIDCKNESKIIMNYQKIFNQLCKNGSLDVAKLFYTNHHVAINDKLFMHMCKLDKIDVLKWLLEKNKKLKIDKGFIISCYHGYLKNAKILFGMMDKSVATLKLALLNTSLTNHVDTINWLLSFNIDIPVNALINSCVTGNVEIAKILNEKNSLLITSIKDVIFIKCCEYNVLDSLLWMESIVKFDDELISSGIMVACSKRSFMVVKHLFDGKDKETIQKIFETCCKEGYIDSCNYIYTTFKTDVNTEAIFDVFITANDIEIIDWLCKTNDNFKLISRKLRIREVISTKKVVGYSISYIEKFMSSGRKTFDEIYNYIDDEVCIDIIYKLCEDDYYIDILKLLFHGCDTILYCYINIDLCFVISCKNNAIKLVEYLIKLGINKKIKNDEFVSVCILGYNEIAKIIYDDGCIDIHYKDDIALKLCHDDVKTWLHEKR